MAKILSQASGLVGNARSGNAIGSYTNSGIDRLMRQKTSVVNTSDVVDKLRRNEPPFISRYYNLSNVEFIKAVQTQQASFESACLKYTDDHTIQSFRLILNVHDPLFHIPVDDSDKRPSAYGYLLAINQLERAYRLRNFQESFRRLVKDFPYYLQSLNGLGDIYKVETNKPYQERKLKIKTLESIDLFISAMLHDYAVAAYDYESSRWVLPQNLRWFDLIVHITEVRQYRTALQKALGETVVVPSTSKYDDGTGNVHHSYETNTEKIEVDRDGLFSLNRYLGAHVIKFDQCELSFDDINTWLGTVDNASPKEIDNSFTIITSRPSLYLTNLRPFEHTQRYYDEIYPYVEHDSGYFKEDESRFAPPEPKDEKSLRDKVMDAVRKEAADTMKGVVRSLDSKLSTTSNIASAKLRDASKRLMNEYKPSNLITRMADTALSMGASKVNSGLNDLINQYEDALGGKTAFFGQGTGHERLASLIVSGEGTKEQQNIAAQISKQNAQTPKTANTERKDLTRQFGENPRSDKQKLIDIIMYGTDEYKLWRDLIFAGHNNQQIR